MIADGRIDPGGVGNLPDFNRSFRIARDLAAGEIRRRVLVPGRSATYAESGHLLWVTEDGMLMAQRFDLDELQLTGTAVLMGDGVAVRGLDRITVAMSRDGTLAYVAGSTEGNQRELVWVRRDGVIMKEQPSLANEASASAKR